jgi:methylated-DNA-[protein]-cysteine S-methyltransferase
MLFRSLATSMGRLLIVGDRDGLRQILMDDGRRPLAAAPGWREDNGELDHAASELHEYFAGHRREFNLALAPTGTPFQRQVWDELAKIPYGATISYGELARRIGKPTASRAVGAANGRNPLPIVIPCHRVIGAGGALVGYGGGMRNKEFLLRLEGAYGGPDLFSEPNAGSLHETAVS